MMGEMWLSVVAGSQAPPIPAPEASGGKKNKDLYFNGYSTNPDCRRPQYRWNWPVTARTPREGEYGSYGTAGGAFQLSGLIKESWEKGKGRLRVEKGRKDG